MAECNLTLSLDTKPIQGQLSELTKPIANIEYRTPQEVFDIMCGRFAAVLDYKVERKTFSPSVLGWKIRQFEDAAVGLSWKGSHHPDEHEDIQINYDEARGALVEYMTRYCK